MTKVYIWNENTAFAGREASENQAERSPGDVQMLEFKSASEALAWVDAENAACAAESAARPGANNWYRRRRAMSVYDAAV